MKPNSDRFALLKTTLRAILLAPVALLLLFEEWGWSPLARCFAKLANLAWWGKLERLIIRVPPWAALMAFGAPVLALVPVKLLALYWLGQGHMALGLTLVIAAKLTGTALAARLFQLTQPALMQLGWFRRWYPRWLVWKDGVIAQVKNARPWRLAQAIARRARRSARKITSFLGL